ncbi:MAG: flagellar basal body rod protein FlgC [Alphaproteobacteria bacterium]|nr:flagellar basal body rod protein FlgC [Alphaproteobacteria bacterium]
MLSDTLKIAAAGMKAQGDRLRIIAENVANADSTSTQPGGEPYRRKVVIFENALNKELGVETVRVAKRTYDMSDFRKKFDPTHPAADEQGYVLFPNVSSIIEMVDMRESRRAYEANINVVEVSKAMLTRTLELLR